MPGEEGDVRVPGIGKIPKKYAIGAVVIGGGIAVIAFMRARSAAASAASGTAGDATGDATGDSGSADGSGYEDPSAYDDGYEDPSAYDSGGASDLGYADPSAYATPVDAAGYPVGSAADLAWQQEQSGAVTTNSEWAAQAIGDTPGDAVQAAIAGVLGGLTVTTAQKNVFMEAVGINGQPPQGYPQPIKTSDTSAQPGPAGTASSKGTIPDVKGKPVADAVSLITEAGFKAKGPTSSTQHLYVNTQEPKGGTSAVKGSYVIFTASAGTAPVLAKRPVGKK
jgi:hypothetical protein